MDIANIHSFVVLAELLSFAKTAEKEHISQSTLSRRIQSLEKGLNVQLFQRDTRNIKLTEAGKEFYFQANKLLEQYHLAISLTKKAVGGYSRKLRIGIGYYEHFFLMPFIGQFSASHPNIKINLYQFVYETLLEYFIRGNLDIILTSDQFLSSISEDAYKKQLLWQDSWSLILSQDNPLAAFPFYRPKTIAGSDHHHYVQWQQQNDPEHLSESGFYRTIPYRNPGQFLCCQNRPGRCQYGDWFCSLIYKNGILQKRSPKKDRSCL